MAAFWEERGVSRGNEDKKDKGSMLDASGKHSPATQNANLGFGPPYKRAMPMKNPTIALDLDLRVSRSRR